MSIDFYEGSKLSLSISEKIFDRLRASLGDLRRRTGRTIDPYGTTSLSPQHASIWLGSLRELLPQLGDAQARAGCQQLIDLLAAAQQRNITLLVEGE